MPEFSADIAASGSADEGSNYTLTCTINGDESLAATNRTFRWDGVDSMDDMFQDLMANDTLTFNPLSRDDAGEYRCNVSFDSPYLIGSQYVMTSFKITVISKCKLDYRWLIIDASLQLHRLCGGHNQWFWW